jgi:hypothetical protein
MIVFLGNPYTAGRRYRSTGVLRMRATYGTGTPNYSNILEYRYSYTGNNDIRSILCTGTSIPVYILEFAAILFTCNGCLYRYRVSEYRVPLPVHAGRSFLFYEVRSEYRCRMNNTATPPIVRYSTVLL